LNGIENFKFGRKRNKKSIKEGIISINNLFFLENKDTLIAKYFKKDKEDIQTFNEKMVITSERSNLKSMNCIYFSILIF